MTVKEFAKAWPLLKKQVKTLDLPWLDELASRNRDPFKILISCLLSLRTKDRTTAEASKRLFSLASSPEEMSKLSVPAIQKAIYPVGFYRVKAGRIKKISAVLLNDYGSKVPDTIEGLLGLEGVGRKTANLVVSLGYGKDGICVDTHVHRITNRWGLVKTKNPTETEFALRKILPRKYWLDINSNLVAFGQGVCRPVSPKCPECSIKEYCQFFSSN
ncbi:MAG: endonuclease III [Nitrospirae bacterium]|nr:MAG: endonuclease III [Nitrospirota bacterium]